MKKLLLLILMFSTLTVSAQTGSESLFTDNEESFVKTAYITPNPAEQEAYVNFRQEADQQIQIEVRDLVGRLVIQKSPGEITWSSRGIQLNLEGLKPGIYLCQIVTETGKVKTVKFQKI